MYTTVCGMLDGSVDDGDDDVVVVDDDVVDCGVAVGGVVDV